MTMIQLPAIANLLYSGGYLVPQTPVSDKIERDVDCYEEIDTNRSFHVDMRNNEFCVFEDGVEIQSWSKAPEDFVKLFSAGAG